MAPVNYPVIKTVTKAANPGYGWGAKGYNENIDRPMEGRMADKTLLVTVDEIDWTKLVPLLTMAKSFRLLEPGYRIVEADGNGRRKSPKSVPHNRKQGQSVISSLMGHYTPRGEFLGLAAQAWTKQAGYSLKSASPALTVLKKHGLVEQIGPGRFRFLRPLAPGEKLT